MNTNSDNIYKINPEREAALFKDAIFFFDTSALLDFYYYSDKTKDQIFKTVFEKLKSRLWIAQQTEFEFLKNRNKVIHKPIDQYKNLITKLKNLKDTGHVDNIGEITKGLHEGLFKEMLGQFQTLQEKTRTNDKHPFFEQEVFSEFDTEIKKLDEYLGNFQKFYETFKLKIESAVKKQTGLLDKVASNDSLLNQFKKSFQTTPYTSFEEIIQIISEGELRYRNSIPPGYLDEDGKIGIQKYGDLIIWKQIIKTSKSKQKPVILIINDGKKDWWNYESNNKPEIPRLELIKEIFDETGNEFWMYNTNDFLFKSQEYFGSQLEKEAIEEVKMTYKENEESLFIKDDDASNIDGEYNDFLKSFNKLKPDCRMLFKLLSEGHSNDEVAEIMNVSKDFLKIKRSRCKKYLMAIYGQMHKDYEDS